MKNMEQAVAFFSVCHSSEREVETQSFARVREHSARLHALVHTPQDFLSHSNDRHVDRIHMHFHENQMDTQHHSVGSTTPLRNPSDTTFGYEATLPPSTVLNRGSHLFLWSRHLFTLGSRVSSLGVLCLFPV